MKLSGKFPALCAAVLSAAALTGCSQSSSSLDDGLGLKSAVAMVTPSALKSDPGSTRGKRYRASERERECLARAMFFESNRSSRDGLVAVGSVVMNRRDTGKWGDDICSVVGAKRQFAPGVMTRPMNSKALPDVMEAADAVLAGERHAKVHQNVMFFHTAGLKFPYKNMYYTTVAGGNSFYEKRSRKRPPTIEKFEQPAIPEVMVASADTEALATGSTALAGSTPSAAVPSAVAMPGPRPMLVAEDRPATQRKTARLASSNRDNGALVTTRKPAQTLVASAAQFPAQPSADRFGAEQAAAPLPEPMESDASFDTQPVMALEASTEQASAVGALLLQQQGQ